MRTPSLLATLLATLASLAAHTSRANAADQPLPNIIYLLADDLGYGDLSCYGQDKLSTPNIDRLAEEGLKFTNHYSGNTVCSPSRASLMTGRHPGHCYLRGNVPQEASAALDPNLTVLPEVLQKAGYATGAFGKWGLGRTNQPGRENPLTHGFDEFYGWKSQTIAHTYYPSSVVDDGREIPLGENQYVHDLIMGRALEFIRRNADAERPFFCYIPTAVPHAAMHAPPQLHEKWRRRLPQFDDKIGKYGAGPDERCPDVQNPIAGFAAMIENLDNQVGEILQALDATGVADNTLVIFASDNGAHLEGGHNPKFWNSTGGLRGHKRDMHEGGIRTPMLARWPAVIKPGRTTQHLSAFWDVLPTFADIAGQPIPEKVDGISFLQTLTGEVREQLTHEYLYWEFRKGRAQKIFSQAVRQANWKAYREKGGTLEIYDLQTDPFETIDLADDRPDIATRMSEIMDAASTPLADSR